MRVAIYMQAKGREEVFSSLSPRLFSPIGNDQISASQQQSGVLHSDWLCDYMGCTSAAILRLSAVCTHNIHIHVCAESFPRESKSKKLTSELWCTLALFWGAAFQHQNDLYTQHRSRRPTLSTPYRSDKSLLRAQHTFFPFLFIPKERD